MRQLRLRADRSSEWLTAVYREGKCQALKELYELRRLYDVHPMQVTDWVRRRSAVSRSDIVELRSICQSSSSTPQEAMAVADGPSATGPEVVERHRNRNAKRRAAPTIDGPMENRANIP
jgi:hypothetical protein